MESSTSGTTAKLNTGASIPLLGFGTWQDKDAQEDAVVEAIKAGYRHIDTARVYGTEPAVGRAIKKSGIPRSEIFITTKLWNNKHHPDDVEQALNESLENLGTDYVDLYLMHWPMPAQRGDNMFPRDSNEKIIPGSADYVETYRAMEACQKTGKARAVGISNFSQHEMERLVNGAGAPPAVHQMEMHPYLQQRGFAEWHAKRGIHITQYSPFGNSNEIYDSGKNIPKMIEDPALKKVAEKHGRTGAQVALAWGIALGHSVIPKSKTPERIRDNLRGDFRLDKEDLDALAAVDRKLRFNNPGANFGWQAFSDLEGQNK